MKRKIEITVLCVLVVASMIAVKVENLLLLGVVVILWLILFCYWIFRSISEN